MIGCMSSHGRAEDTTGAAETPPPVHDARHLTAGGATAVIELDGVSYTLRITRQGKLILTK